MKCAISVYFVKSVALTTDHDLNNAQGRVLLQ